MINYRILLLLSMLLVGGMHSLMAQYAYFGTSGKISFDKITYLRAKIKNQISASRPGQGGMRRMDFDLQNIDESTTQKMELLFDDQQTLFRNSASNDSATVAATQAPIAVGGGYRGGQRNQQVRTGRRRSEQNPRQAEEKFIFQDLKHKSSEIQLFIDEQYLLQDSLTAITWRFTDEYRNIAGFECRRVNGATSDSLYLVAYYSEQIPVSAGPALAHGLPGMILGLVIPELHIHYWATAVTYNNEAVPKDWRDKKSQTMSFTDFSNAFGRNFQRGGLHDTFRRRILEQLIY